MIQQTLVERCLLVFNFLKFIFQKIYPLAGTRCAEKAIGAFFLLLAVSGYGQLSTETFESGLPSSWAQANNGTGVTPWTISADGYLSDGSAFIDPTTEDIGIGNISRHYLITPLVTVPANGEIRFFTKQSDIADHGNIYEVRLSTASQTDIAGYTTVLASYTEAQLNTVTPLDYEEKIIPIPDNIAPGLNVYIAFVLVNDQPDAIPDADTWFIDDVSVQSVEACEAVLAENLQVTDLTTASANISWIHPTATDFQIQVIADGAAPGATGADTDNTYTASGLEEDTDYDVYIKAICTASESAWAGPFDLSTLAAGMSCENPIVIPDSGDLFELSSNLDQFQNPDAVYSTQGTDCLSSAITQNYLNGAKVFLSFTPTQNGLLNLSQTTLPYASGTGCWGNADSGVFVYEGCSNVGVECIGGMRTTTTDAPSYISNLFVEAGETYIIVISSSYDITASVCFDFTAEFSTCAPPAAFSYDNLLQTSVEFSWDNEAGLSDSWEYVVQPAGAGEPTGSGTATSTNSNNVINTGLTAGTAYDLYVRSVCGGVPSSWSSPYSFTTQCPVFDTPYSTSFTDTWSAPEPCWTPIDVNGDGTTWGYQGDSARMQLSENQNYNNDMMVTPQVNFDGVQKRLRYKYNVLNGAAGYSIRLSTTGIGQDNFVTIVMPETEVEETGWDVWEEKIINLSPDITGYVNIAFVISPGEGQTATSISIDDVFIEDKPACPDPLELSATNITTSSADLSWIAGDAETQWQIAVQPKDTGAPTEGELINDNSYTATPLNHATEYEYYVRAYCNDDEQSNWVGPYYFTTLCDTFYIPFYESFNDGDTGNSHKFCWTTNDVNGDGAQWQLAATEARIQGNAFWGTPEYDDWLISPAINVEGIKELKFKYKAAFSFFFPNPRFGVQVLMSTTDTDPASFTEIMPLMDFTNTDYIEKSLYISANGPVYIAFRVPPAFSTAEGTSIFQLDDVRIEDAPACPSPNSGELSASNITQTTALLSWTPGFQETQWQVVVQEAGTGTPSGDGTLTDNNTAYPAGPLTPDTQYEYYVRAYCSDSEQSEWVGPYTFTTLCDPFTAPFIETFEDDSVSEDCWRSVNGNSDSFDWNLEFTINPYAGIHSAGIFTGSNGNNDDWLISPTITVTAGQRLRYYYRVYSPDFIEDVEVRLSVNGNELSEFTTILYTTDDDPDPLNNPEWKEKVINLPAGVTGNINIAWHIPQKEPNPWGYRGQMFIIDDVIIEDIPECPQPSNLTVQNITDVQAQIGWDANGTETACEVYVQPAGLPAPVGNGDPLYLHNATTNPFTVSGLTPAAEYDFYVRTLCEDEEEVEWISGGSFVTLCSFENVCEYTITLISDNNSGVGGGIDLIQNGVVSQTMEFPTGPWGEIPPPAQYTVFLCDGVEFSLFWDAVGTAPGQYPGAQILVEDAAGDEVYTGPLGIGIPRTTVYTGMVSCSAITCPQPENLAVNESGVISWTAGGTETQWEVFIQPLGNGTLPQTGVLVDTTSYAPAASDFDTMTEGTYEFFVRAVCDDDTTSFWSGPFEFVRNDSSENAIAIPVSGGEACEGAVTNVSFINATVSTEAMSCGGTNEGDVWVEFVATAKVHAISLINFSGEYYYSEGNTPQPKVTMTLYSVNDSDLEEMACSYNNVILAAYSTELIVGETYKVRLSLNSEEHFSHTFEVCVTTPQDLCSLDAINGSFEYPEADFGIYNFYTQNVVPGWRNNLLESDTSLYEVIFFENALGVSGYIPYDGGQSIQLISPDTVEPTDPSDLINIKGTYQDFDSSEITKYDYSFAHLSRTPGTVVQLYAGPPSGPFELLEENSGTMVWNLYEGEYIVPEGQPVTRFIFRSKDNAIGNVIDAVSIVPNNRIITEPHALECTETETSLSANGTGMWVADENNPSETVFANADNSTTEVTGFTASGDYTFYWRTRYCEYSIVIANVAVDDAPEAASPVEYCQGADTVVLTAPALEGHTLAWYLEPAEGVALTEAPVPSSATVGTTSYYVAYVNAEGCEGPRAQIDVIVNAVTSPITGFAYDFEEYCAIGTVPIITLDEGFTAGGVFSVSTAGLIIDPETGAIDIEESGAGTYEVTYSVPAVECVSAGSSTVSVTINQPAIPVTEFAYTTPLCLGTEEDVLPVPAEDFVSGGTYSSATLVIDPVTGQIDVTAATAGTHNVTYSVGADASACIEAGTYTFELELVNPVVPVTEFVFAESYCIADVNPAPVLAEGFTTGGTFTSGTGLAIDAVTGEIDLANSTAGSFDVTYTVPGGTCIEEGTSTVTVTINDLAPAVVEFSFDTPSCITSGDELVPSMAEGFTFGGAFSSETLAIDPETGIIDLTTATAGVHNIVYTIDEDVLTCTSGGTYTATIELVSGVVPVTQFSYNDVYCADSENAIPQTVEGFTAGGIFESGEGLVIDPVTGEINIQSSTAGTYQITYTIAADTETCNLGGSHTATITVVGDINIQIAQDCRDNDTWLEISSQDSGLGSGVAYEWRNESGAIVGNDSPEFNVTQYYEANGISGLPLVFTVTVTSGSCTSETSYTVESIMCNIPRGISPNGDGRNDSFDLTDLGVTDIVIFNRYGKEVFSKGGGYTNQWHGQDNNNNELPTGTYFYSVNKINGESVTGWVYINRE